MHNKVISSLCERYGKSKTIRLHFSSLNTLSPSKTLFREAIRNTNSFLSDIGPNGDYGGCFWNKIWRGGGRGIYFFEKVKIGRRDPILWWELLPNMPGRQSLKALLFFVKEQCWTTTPLIVITLPFSFMEFCSYICTKFAIRKFWLRKNYSLLDSLSIV